MADEKPARTPTKYAVEPGTRPSTCSGKEKGGSCTATIYWTKSAATGARIPVDCSAGRAPNAGQWGSGVSHYTTCPDAALFRRKK